MKYYNGEKLISVNNLSFKYGNKTILRDIGTPTNPFDILNLKKSEHDEKHPFLGQTVAVLGSSGSGKSTFFKIMAGLISPYKGEVLVPKTKNEEELVPVKEGDVGFVQQNYPLSRNQTVISMLIQAAKQGNIKSNEIDHIVSDYIKKWGLENQKNQAPSQLSGGQRQRVAILEQLLCSHYFMIFDEPFSGLDVRNIQDVKNSFKQINELEDINTIIFSTHDIDLAVELADMIYVLGNEDGKDGSTIIANFDLKQLGLAWTSFGSDHKKLSNDIADIICKS